MVIVTMLGSLLRFSLGGACWSYSADSDKLTVCFSWERPHGPSPASGCRWQSPAFRLDY